jgi:hypothetical protein
MYNLIEDSTSLQKAVVTVLVSFSGLWIIHTCWKNRNIREKIRNKQTECKDSLNKLEGYIKENGVRILPEINVNTYM